MSSIPVVIRGATGANCDKINGTYIPSTTEMVEGYPVYFKENDPSMCLELNNKVWSIKMTAERGSGSNAFMRRSFAKNSLPYVGQNKCEIFDPTVYRWIVDESIILKDKTVFFQEYAKLYYTKTLECRSVEVKYTDKASSHYLSINGVFEVSDLMVNDWPVYLKRNDRGTCLSFCSLINSWLIQPSDSKGSENGFLILKCIPTKRPELCDASKCQVRMNNGQGFTAASGVTIKAD
eukprot:gene15859-21492_t